MGEAILAMFIAAANERMLMTLATRLKGPARYSQTASQIAAFCLDPDPWLRSRATRNPLATDADLVGAALMVR